MKRTIPGAINHLLFAALFVASVASAQIKKEFVYFGTTPKAAPRAIYVSRLDVTTGKLTAPEVAVETKGSGFLAIHPNHKFLYAIGDYDKATDKPAGAVKAFAIDAKTGKLTFLNEQSSVGKGPAHLTVDHSGKCVLVANYGGGSIAALPINEDGTLGEAKTFIQHTGSSVNPTRQKEPHAHSINVDPANHYAFVADLGLDKVLVYKLDSTKASLVPNDPPFATVKPGSGPRHFAFSWHGHYAYVINEMACTITGFNYDADRGTLTEVQTVSTLPEGVSVEQGMSTAELQVHPTGKWVYGSNRGHDTIAVFDVERETGKLKLIQNEPTQGKIPRNFGIDPTGHFLLAANQNSDTVVVFKIDEKTGRLTATGQKLDVPVPMCVRFLVPDATTTAPEVARWPRETEFSGKGPISSAPWFVQLWAVRRTDFWNNQEKDKGAVVFLGDSITQGWGTLAKDFPNLKVANRGIAGDTTRGVLYRLKEDVLDLDPEAVVLLIGTNDLGLSGTPEEAAENIDTILRRITDHNPKAPIVVCKVMPSSAKMFRPGDKIKKLNGLVDDVMKKYPQTVRCDTWSIFVSENDEPKKEEFPDLLHPNAIGYAKWTDALMPILTKLNLQKK